MDPGCSENLALDHHSAICLLAHLGIVSKTLSNPSCFMKKLFSHEFTTNSPHFNGINPRPAFLIFSHPSLSVTLHVMSCHVPGQEKKAFEDLVQHLRIDDSKIATYQGKHITPSDGACTADTVAGGTLSYACLVVVTSFIYLCRKRMSLPWITGNWCVCRIF